MKILGIESSCDETSAAVVEDGRRLLSNVVNSQIDIHAVYGGVIPEVAARSHLEVVLPVIHQALADAGCTWDDIDAIAVTYAPGLVGSLMIGTLTARTLALIHGKPLFPIHHVEGHVYANFLIEESSVEDGRLTLDVREGARMRGAEDTVVGQSKDLQHKSGATGETARADEGSAFPAEPDKTNSQIASGAPEAARAVKPGPPRLQLPSREPSFPLLALIVSGGHSQLALFRGHGDYELLGQTQDDAVGEAFDKVAKIIGLPYPGGPSIATAALLGNPHAYEFPKARMQNPYDFSFSGLKTAVLRRVQAECSVGYDFPSYKLAERLDEVKRNNLAASFQRVAVETLVDKTVKAYREYSPASVVIAGGVAANQELRRQLSAALPIEIEYAPMNLCTDNGAMIATLGYYFSQVVPPTDPRVLENVPHISMTKTAWAKS